MWRQNQKRFKDFQFDSGDTLSDILASIHPRTKDDLDHAIEQVFGGHVPYQQFDPPAPGSRVSCHSLVGDIAIFFDDDPPGTFVLVDAQLQTI